MHAVTARMAEEIRQEMAQGVKLEEIRDRSGEYVESYLPIYNNEIIKEWQEMPSQYDDLGATELGISDDAGIISRMLLDLYLCYLDAFENAIAPIEQEQEADN